MRGNEQPTGRQVATWERNLGSPYVVLELTHGSFFISVRQNVKFEVRELGGLMPPSSSRCVALGRPHNLSFFIVM